MTTVDAHPQVSARGRGRTLAVITGLAILSVLITAVVAIMDHTTVATPRTLGRVMFGFPLDWLAQDQTALSPQFAIRLSPASPWANPTTVAVGPFVVDAVLAFVTLLVGVGAARSILRSRVRRRG